MKLKHISGELFVKNMLISYFYVVTIKKYKVKKFCNKLSEIFRKTGINFRKFSCGKFPEISKLTTLDLTLHNFLPYSGTLNLTN